MHFAEHPWSETEGVSEQVRCTYSRRCQVQRTRCAEVHRTYSIASQVRCTYMEASA